MLTFNCPRWTSNSLLQEVLIRNKTSFKTDLLSRYDKFYKSQRTSFSQEVRVFLLFLYTTTSNNMKVMMVQLETDVRTVSAGKLKPRLHTNPLVGILYFLYTIKISAAQNLTPDIVNIFHSLIHKALLKYRIGLYI